MPAPKINLLSPRWHHIPKHWFLNGKPTKWYCMHRITSSPVRQRGIPLTGKGFTEFLQAAMDYAMGTKRLVQCLNPGCPYFGLMIWTRDVYVCPCCGMDQHPNIEENGGNIKWQ